MNVNTQLICPNCHEDPEIDGPLELFDVVECHSCGHELDVTDTDPVVLKVLSDEEEFEDTDEYDESSDFEEEEDEEEGDL